MYIRLVKTGGLSLLIPEAGSVGEVVGSAYFYEG